MSIRVQPLDLRVDGWTKTTRQQNNEAAGLGITDQTALRTPIESLTEGKVDGNGVFDKMIAAAKIHLQEEFNAGRLVGGDYANAYMSTMAATMQSSVQFLMNRQQAERINAEIGLLRQQTATELANTDDNIPMGLAFNHVPDEITSIPVLT